MGNRLTAAGRQVERALAQGFDVAAFNLYIANIRDDVPMVEGDWPEWHRMIQAKIGFDEARLAGEDLADDLVDRGELDEDDRDSFLDDVAAHEPSLIERNVRDKDGVIVAMTTIPNPHASSCGCDLCRDEEN